MLLLDITTPLRGILSIRALGLLAGGVRLRVGNGQNIKFGVVTPQPASMRIRIYENDTTHLNHLITTLRKFKTKLSNNVKIWPLKRSVTGVKFLKFQK